MFGIGGSEILVILVVALLFLGPDKLPDAARQISKGIRDLKKQGKILTQTIENDETIGGALRDIKSALRGDEIAPRPPIKKLPNKIEGDKPELAAAEAKPDQADVDKDADVAMGIINNAAAKLAPPPTEEEIAARDKELHEAEVARIKLPDTAGEPNAEDGPDLKGTHDAEELAKLIKPPVGVTAARDADKNG
ncbi:MAG TPA: twin-arginine translocase TatA/TatE family subunit [Kofleriaceae bacterium]